MEFSVTSIVSMPISTLLPGKSSTVSYGYSYFSVLEVRHVLFRVYYMWRVTRIRDKCFAVMLLVLFFHDKSFSYITSSMMLFSDYFPPFYPCSNPCIRHFSFFNNWIYSYYICSCCYFILLLDSILTVFLDMSGFLSWMTFWYVSTLFMTELFSLVPIFSTSCAGNVLLVFYVKRFFIFSWSSLSWFFVHLVKFHQNIVMDSLNS